MKKIVLYCGIIKDDSVGFTGEVYVRNAPEYLAMSNVERVIALTGLIAELSQELEFVSNQINNQETSSKGPRIPQ